MLLHYLHVKYRLVKCEICTKYNKIVAPRMSILVENITDLTYTLAICAYKIARDNSHKKPYAWGVVINQLKTIRRFTNKIERYVAIRLAYGKPVCKKSW